MIVSSRDVCYVTQIIYGFENFGKDFVSRLGKSIYVVIYSKDVKVLKNSYLRLCLSIVSFMKYNIGA